MSDNTAIEWADSTMNPWIGCTRVSPACDDCYAARSTPARALGVEWGPGQPRRRTAPSTWKKPLRWNREAWVQCTCGYRGPSVDGGGCGACGKHATVTPTRRRVFCASLADVFDNEVDPAWRADLFKLIESTPNLDWLLLTKRIGNVNAMTRYPAESLPDNVWLGATVVNQEEADRDIPKLLQIPARVRFLSIEPMLGPVDLRLWLEPCDAGSVPAPGGGRTCPHCEGRTMRGSCHPLNWVIAGGESGPKARPVHPDWIRSLRDQCAAAGVPFLFKQWGEWGPLEQNRGLGWKVGDERTGFFDDEGWHHMGVSSHGPHLLRVGKKVAGRLLDGREWNGFPEGA